MSSGVKPRLPTNCDAASAADVATASEAAGAGGVGGVVAGTPFVVDVGTAAVLDAVFDGNEVDVCDVVEVTGAPDVGAAILAALLPDVDVTDRTELDAPCEWCVELHPHAATTAMHADAMDLADRDGNRVRVASDMQFDRTANAVVQRFAPKSRAKPCDRGPLRPPIALGADDRQVRRLLIVAVALAVIGVVA